MARPCPICAHPASTAIDAALLDGESSYSLGTTYGLSPQAVARHKREHLLAGRRPIPPETPAVAKVKKPGHRPPTALQSAAAQVQTIKVEAARQAQLPAPGATAGQTVEDAPDLPVNGEDTGLYKGKGQVAFVGLAIRELMELAMDAKVRKEVITAIVAIKEAGNMALKLIKVAPDGEEVKPDAEDEQEKLKALINEAIKILPHPSPDWRVK